MLRMMFSLSFVEWSKSASGFGPGGSISVSGFGPGDPNLVGGPNPLGHPAFNCVTSKIYIE